MVVPGSTSVIQPDHTLGTELSRSSAENSVMGPDTESMADQVGPELEEVRKLQQLVRRLELQNQQLRTRSLRSVPEAKMLSQADAGVDNCNSRLNGMEMNNSINVLMDKQELQIVADLHSALSKIRSEAEESGKFFKKDAEESTIQHGCENISDQEPSGAKFVSSTQTQNNDANTNDVPRWDCNPTVLLEDFSTCVEPVLQMKEANTNAEGPLDETALDEVELLELENGSDEEDSWYVLYEITYCSSKGFMIRANKAIIIFSRAYYYSVSLQSTGPQKHQ